MLDAAGVEYEMEPAAVDETGFKTRVREPAELALDLARAKAECVSGHRPQDWVIGSDSVVNVDGQVFSKPADRK